MTHTEYYRIVADRWEKVDKTDRQAIHDFNEWRRQLHHEVFDEKEGK